MNMKLVKIIRNVRSQKQIDDDRTSKNKFNNARGWYSGGFSKDTTPDDCIIEYEANDGTIKQVRKYLKKNTKGFYVEHGGERCFFKELNNLMKEKGEHNEI